MLSTLKQRWHYAPKILFFALIIKPVVLILLGLNVRGKQNLPKTGGALIIANHNSHLDAVVLMSLYPLTEIHRIRPVAAMDYFFRHKWLRWFVTRCIDVIPLNRDGSQAQESLFDEVHNALDQGDILILFPEGSRGKPEKIGELKKGLYHLMQQRKQYLPVIPVMLRGLGKALPKGEALLVPFNCDVIVGEPLVPIEKDADEFLIHLYAVYAQLAQQCVTKHIVDV